MTFAAASQLVGDFPARDLLERRGIRCVRPADASSVEEFILHHGAGMDLVVLCRVFCGGRFLEQVQRDCGRARIVFNSIDLNFVREERRARVLGDQGLLDVALSLRGREEAVIRGSDATMVVSSAERDLLADSLPDAYVVQMPLARPVRPPRADFAQRRGVGFVGGFAHAPNVDAVRYFLAETWPLVRASMPDCPFSIVGDNFPAGLLDGVAGDVRVLGHVPDIDAWFETLRVSVAPLRYGAGAKGKVASSLAAGVPCVVTPVAAEGMALAPGGGVLVASTPAAFAACVRDVHTDPVLWRQLSNGGLGHARASLSLEGWRDRLDAMLRRIGL